MLVTSFEEIARHVGDVTPAQIGKAHKVFDLTPPASPFYQVENAAGARDETGALIEYQVKYDPEKGYTCTCKSGKEGFENVRKHPSRVCWHVRAAVACELEARAYEQELAAKKAAQLEERQGHPAWHNPGNETSYANGSRAALELDANGKELSDAQYRTLVLKPTEESKRPFPAHWLERR